MRGICLCICAGRIQGIVAVGKVAHHLIAIVLMTVRDFWSVAARMTSMQMPTMSRAAQVSHSS